MARSYNAAIGRMRQFRIHDLWARLSITKHQEHIHYEQFKQMDFPIGSGLVEITCKWLVEQRFKGFEICCSEAGFNYLLHMRLAWVNPTFRTQ